VTFSPLLIVGPSVADHTSLGPSPVTCASDFPRAPLGVLWGATSHLDLSRVYAFPRSPSDTPCFFTFSVIVVFPPPPFPLLFFARVSSTGQPIRSQPPARTRPSLCQQLMNSPLPALYSPTDIIRFLVWWAFCFIALVCSMSRSAFLFCEGVWLSAQEEWTVFSYSSFRLIRSLSPYFTINSYVVRHALPHRVEILKREGFPFGAEKLYESFSSDSSRDRLRLF